VAIRKFFESLPEVAALSGARLQAKQNVIHAPKKTKNAFES
jgi:hypothetical protein